MSDAVYDMMTASSTVPPVSAGARDDERPPACPTCNRRLVILASHWTTDERGQPLRRQMWGCPRGHATAYRVRGVFTPIELLDDVN